jgi:hypothetical protein
MPCRHKRCHLTITLVAQNKYEILDNIPPKGVRVESKPVAMRIVAYCRDCAFTSTYNTGADIETRGASAWPVWLLNHMRTLCEVDESLSRACIACRVPVIVTG